MSDLDRLLVSVKQARAILGDIGHGRFWALAKAGEFTLVGSARKRFVTTDSLRAYVQRQVAAAKAAPSKRSRRNPACQVHNWP